MKNISIIVLAIIILGGGYFFFMNKPATESEEVVVEESLPANSLVGVWQSIEDANFIRTIYENGGYMDTYTGNDSATTEGSWVTFDAENAPEEFPYPIEEDAEYLEMKEEAGSLYFTIVEVTEEKLVLIFLDRGGVLEFTRI